MSTILKEHVTSYLKKHSTDVRHLNVSDSLKRDQEFCKIPGSRDFWDRISLKLYPGILPKKYGDFTKKIREFGQFHTVNFW